MTQHPIGIIGFSHVCIAVSDAEASLRFYLDLLGLDVFFDVELEGPPMEVVTGEVGASGRMIGGMLGGTPDLVWQRAANASCSLWLQASAGWVRSAVLLYQRCGLQFRRRPGARVEAVAKAG